MGRNPSSGKPSVQPDHSDLLVCPRSGLASRPVRWSLWTGLCTRSAASAVRVRPSHEAARPRRTARQHTARVRRLAPRGLLPLPAHRHV